MKKLQEV